MGRLLGIDYGKKRVGLALSDPLGMFASGLTTLILINQKQLLKELTVILKEHDVEKVILGLPLKSTGERGEMTELVEAFGTVLQETTGLPVFYEDERFTSIIAQQSLIAQGIQPSKKKHLVDQTSAALILQQYLDKMSR